MGEQARGRHVERARDRGVAGGGGYLYRPGEVLVRREALGAVIGRLRRAARRPVGRAERIAGLGVVRVRLTGTEADGRVPEVVRELRAAGLPAVPNHVLRSASHINVRPAAPPTSAGALTELPSGADLPGRGVRVGVIDSGVWREHPWLAGRVEAGRGDSEADPDGTPHDVEEHGQSRRLRYYAGHGTFIAGVVLQHAPGASVVARRVLHDGDVDDTTLATLMLELADVDVLNLSLGTTVDPHLDDDDVKALMATADSLIELGRRNPKLVVVAPAGNDGKAAEVWPAAFGSVVSVAALDDAAKERASFSNHGDWVDAGARGEDVHSAFVRWTGRLEPPRHHGHEGDGDEGEAEGDFDGFARWSGTSFAAPRVAAAVAVAIGEGAEPSAAVAAVLSSSGRTVPGCGAVVDPPSFVSPAAAEGS